MHDCDSDRSEGNYNQNFQEDMAVNSLFLSNPANTDIGLKENRTSLIVQ